VPVYWIEPKRRSVYRGVDKVPESKPVGPQGQRGEQENTFERQSAQVLQEKIRRKRVPVRTAGQLMTEAPITIEPGATMLVAAALFEEATIRHLPVVDEGKLVGVLSDRDVLRGHASAEHRDEPAPRRARRVEQAMSTRVLTATPKTPLREAARAMLDERISALPVVDDEGGLVGILTTTDILRALMRDAPVDLWA
jgi:acetoin utilization protein AcuB